MATAYTTLLGLALPVTGELASTWGDMVNNSITNLVEDALAETTTLSTDADVTLSTTTGAANQARNAIILCSGARSAVRTITAPAQSKTYIIINATTGGYAVNLVGVGPTTGLSIANGQRAVVAWNGSDFVLAAAPTLSPVLTTPTLGVASATSINKVAITAPATSATLTIADGKTLTASNTLTFTGTDASSVAFGTGGTVAYTANNLSAFAATTSAQLAGVISDETGSGALVFGTSPTLATPVINGLPTGTGVATANTVSTLVARDGSGNFAAGTITAALTGNASTATKLATARAINGVDFDGTAAITVTAAAGTLTGTTLAANVVNASLNAVTPTGGTFAVTGALSATGGIQADTYYIRASGSGVPASGAGLELLYGASGAGISTILSYDRTGAAYKPLYIDGLTQSFYISGVATMALSSTGLAVTGALSATSELSARTTSAKATVGTSSIAYFRSSDVTNPSNLVVRFTGAAAQADRVVLLDTSEENVGFGGTLALQSGGGATTIGGGLAVTGAFTTSTGFGCNGKTAQTAYASGGAATDAATTQTLANNIRLALVANGIMS